MYGCIVTVTIGCKCTSDTFCQAAITNAVCDVSGVCACPAGYGNLVSETTNECGENYLRLQQEIPHFSVFSPLNSVPFRFVFTFLTVPTFFLLVPSSFSLRSHIISLGSHIFSKIPHLVLTPSRFVPTFPFLPHIFPSFRFHEFPVSFSQLQFFNHFHPEKLATDETEPICASCMSTGGVCYDVNGDGLMDQCSCPQHLCMSGPSSGCDIGCCK